MQRIKLQDLPNNMEINKEEMRQVFGGKNHRRTYEDSGARGYTGTGAEPYSDDAEDRWNAIKTFTRLGCSGLIDLL